MVSRLATALLGGCVAFLLFGLAGCDSEPPRSDEAVGSPGASPAVAPEASAALRSLPYADWVPLEKGESREGVTRWIPNRAAPGFTLFTPRFEARALLIDLAGRPRHVWAADLVDGDSLRDPRQGSWQHVELLPGGDLVVVIKDLLLARIDWDSQLVWSIEGRFHHEVVRAPGETDRLRLWALDRRERLVPYPDGPDGEIPVLTDRVLEIDAASGEVLRTVDLWPALRGFVDDRLGEVARWFAERGGHAAMGALLPDTPPDVFHTNSVVELDRDVPGLGKEGDLLLSVRHLNRVVLVDPRTGELGWVWGEEAGLDGQHHATVLESGRVLLFDNGRERGWSRVLEMDPATGQVVWTYRAVAGDTFWSPSRGSSQRLADGNTLITESDFGRLFEVTSRGEVVWEYLSAIESVIETPAGSGGGSDGEPARAAIYRAARIEGELLASLAEPLRRSRKPAR